MRLRGVTQVISPCDDLVLHDRLTHSLKVSSIGGTIARVLLRKCCEILASGRILSNISEGEGEILDSARSKLLENKDSLSSHRISRADSAKTLTELWELEPIVVEAAGLAHDLGHPPFGHIGEKVLNELGLQKELKGGYEGNAQSFRILTELECGYLAEVADKGGLNLTNATLNAVLKYPWLYDKEKESKSGVKRWEKWGAYNEDAEDFNFARELLPAETEEKSREAEIMDLADEIAYAVHDLLDFVRAGLIPLEVLSKAHEHPPERAAQTNDELANFLRKGESLGSVCSDRLEAIRALRGYLRDRWQKPYDNSVKAERVLNGIGASLTRNFVKTFTSELFAQRLLSGKPLSFSTESSTATEYSRLEGLKQFTWHYVIESPNLATQQWGHKRLLRKLFEVFFHEANHSNSKFQMFPKRFQSRLRESANIERLTIDFISSLTEQQALRYYQRLFGTNSGTVTDHTFS